MAFLGIDRNSGLVYEGFREPIYPSWPSPLLSQATLIETPSDLEQLPATFDQNDRTWMFRENSYDPVSRIRRGYLFQKNSLSSWESRAVEPHSGIFSDQYSAQPGVYRRDGRVEKQIHVYDACLDLLGKKNQGEGMQIALGVAKSYSMWRVLQTELNFNSSVLVTLRAESAYGILPEIDRSKIFSDSLPHIDSAIARLLNAAYKELPTSVVDQCRNVMTVLVSIWMQQERNEQTPATRDLGPWIREIQQHFTEQPRVALLSALEIVNRLHPRGKDNEKSRLKLRAVTEEDAAFAVHAVGFVIREIGWARN